MKANVNQLSLLGVFFLGMLMTSCEYRAFTTDRAVNIKSDMEINNDGSFSDSASLASDGIASDMDVDEEGYVSVMQITGVKLKADFNSNNEATSFKAIGTYKIGGNRYNLFAEESFDIADNVLTIYPVTKLDPTGLSKLRDYMAQVYNHKNYSHLGWADPGDITFYIDGYPVQPSSVARFSSLVTVVVELSVGFRACYEVPAFFGDECKKEEEPLVTPKVGGPE